MATFVLVHGAWHGGWCYRDTARALRAAGHDVFTPTHTGLGERAHLAGEGVTMETHIRDICGVLEAEELSNVILCGHSYGGMVITGVADRMPERIKALVYLDAFVPENGQSSNDALMPGLEPEMAAGYVSTFRSSALTTRGMVAAMPSEVFQVATAENRAWVDRRCTAQSLATWEMPLMLTGAGDTVKQRGYIVAEGWGPSPFPYLANKYDGQPGWRVLRFPCGHDLMVDMPGELAAGLLNFV